MPNEIIDVKFYDEIKKILSEARQKVYATANFAMVKAYWEIGKSIVEKQGGNATAEYGEGLIKNLSLITRYKGELRICMNNLMAMTFFLPHRGDPLMYGIIVLKSEVIFQNQKSYLSTLHDKST